MLVGPATDDKHFKVVETRGHYKAQTHRSDRTKPRFDQSELSGICASIDILMTVLRNLAGTRQII